MALSLTKTNDVGVVTNYHKVGRAEVRNSELMCSLDSYVSKEYREQERAAESTTFMFNITVEEEESMGIRALCYTKIKQIPGWETAEDC